MKTKQRLAYSFVNDKQERISILVVEAKFGWLVTKIKNGEEISKTTEMGSMMTVMNDAMIGL